MKKNIVFVALLGMTLVLASCGSSKQKAASDYEYQLWKQQQEQQRPARKLRATEPCIELALAESGNMRAYGTATSYVEKTALNEAERDARNRLAAMIKAAVEGAAQDYEQNANQNLKKTAGTLSESVMTQYVAEEIKNTRIIKNSIYDLTDGSIQVYVCLEMKTDTEELKKSLDNALDRDGLIELQYDRERFLDKMSEGLEEYKKKQAEGNL
ncbi:MAG TPA: hypothetical protein H9925_02290 [Candidatus Phocaeicola gallinarum]|nr:hypothetical protein [Candidatus Phocaeicola gallinarum]